MGNKFISIEEIKTYEQMSVDDLLVSLKKINKALIDAQFDFKNNGTIKQLTEQLKNLKKPYKDNIKNCKEHISYILENLSQYGDE